MWSGSNSNKKYVNVELFQLFIDKQVNLNVVFSNYVTHLIFYQYTFMYYLFVLIGETHLYFVTHKYTRPFDHQRQWKQSTCIGHGSNSLISRPSRKEISLSLQMCQSIQHW